MAPAAKSNLRPTGNRGKLTKQPRILPNKLIFPRGETHKFTLPVF